MLGIASSDGNSRRLIRKYVFRRQANLTLNLFATPVSFFSECNEGVDMPEPGRSLAGRRVLIRAMVLVYYQIKLEIRDLELKIDI